MTDENTPLIDDDYYQEYSGPWSSPYVRYATYASCILLGVPLLYFFLVILPNEIPPSESINRIAIAAAPHVYLHPVIKPIKTKSVFVETPLDHDPLYSVSVKDPDDPIKSVPNIAKWEYMDPKSTLFKSHVSKLSKYSPAMKPVKRLILIGDIHGSYKPLMRLMKRVKYNQKFDRIVMLGDFLAKGKQSREVLNWAVAQNVSCVLGNHEVEILKRYAQMHALPKLSYVGRHENDTSIDEAYDLDDLMKIAKQLTPKDIQYLRECPLIQELGPVPHLTNERQTKYFPYPAEGYAVHAGLSWNITELEDQDPNDVTTMRNLLPPDWVIATEDKHEKVDGKKSEPWSKHWNIHEKKNVSSELKNSTDIFSVGRKVYYGHDAGRGVVVRPYSLGLDSGCVYGSALSAEIIWAEVITKKAPVIKYKHQFVQVNCS